MNRVNLDGAWTLERADGESEPLEGTVPGGVYGDLLAAERIEEPAVEDNELDVQWVAETDWAYERSFEVGDSILERERATLVCHGLDTVAEISVNGERVGETENMHRRYEFDVTDLLRAGDNEIRVVFRSPIAESERRADEYPIDLPMVDFPVQGGEPNHLRKAQCHFGWDWGPCLPEMGIWRSIELVAHDGPRIRYVVPEQTHRTADGAVDLDVRVGLETPAAGEYEASLSVTGAGAEETVAETRRLEGGRSEIELSTTVDDPELWWPAGHGDQPLADLEVGVGADAEGRRIGFREIELVREPDADGEGESFGFRVNGEEIYVKGANWIPTDAVYARQTPERYDDLLESAVAANMNAVRVWGGGQYERRRFYRRCDELGLLVWQDFMYACATYPGDEAFLAEADAEARHQLRRLASHPSIALWCGNNEIEAAIEHWFDEHPDHDALVEGYDDLFHEVLPAAVGEEDPTRAYWPSSPSNGGEGDPEDPSRGDVHYWDVWHGGEPLSNYEEVEPRFASEFGYQSFPSPETLAGIVPEEQWNPTAPLMEHHQRNPAGNATILRRLADHFRFPAGFENFAYLSQLLQGLAMKTAIEHWRRAYPRCRGTLYWQLNDVWPVASWSSIEYGGEWKALQHLARRFYAPVLPSLRVREETDELAVWLTSDRLEGLDGEVTVRTYALEGDRAAGASDADAPADPVFERTFDVSFDGADSEELARIPLEAVRGGLPPEAVAIRVAYDGPGESYPNHAFLAPHKHLDLPESAVSVEPAPEGVAVSATNAALFVSLETDANGRFADDAFHLVPGERRVVPFEGDADPEAVAADATIRHLRETY